MCTLTWWEEGGRYGVLFNRDESVLRSRAQPPAVFNEDGLRSLRPTDPDGGGTWIWVNEAGVIACLLNNYTATGRVPEEPVSRGLLLVSCAQARSLTQLRERMSAIDCDRYRGFYLFGYDGSATVLFSWDGSAQTQCSQSDITCPLTTSGFLPDEVPAHRREQYRAEVVARPGSRFENLQTYHLRHDPGLPAHSVLMVRSDARTVSHSRVVVDEHQVSFSYRPVAVGTRLQPAIVMTLDRES